MAELTKDEYDRLAERVNTDYEADEEDRSDWLKSTEIAIEVANQVKKEKTFPYKGASNIKLPMILDASIKFATRAYSEIIPGGNVVKSSVIHETDEKAERAKRVTDYMSWQLLHDDVNWEADTDKLLHMLPIVGHMFRKRYYCSAKQRADSQLIMPDKICCSKDGRRKTQIHTDVPYSDILSKQRSGEWRDVDLLENQEFEKLEERPKFDLLESHCWIDIDNDGYEEPYVVIIEKESMKVLSLKPRYEAKDVTRNAKQEIVRIEAIEYIIDYMFIPNFAGGYYGVGFGQLLMPLTEAANSLMNQLVDAGTLNNIQGGFVDERIKIKSGSQNFKLGEWKKANCSTIPGGRLVDGVMPMPTKEPSQTLFSLLGLIVEMTKDLGSVKDILSGDTPASNMPATTTVALIEQGMKTFSAIYKRIYRSLKNEFNLLYRLDGLYLDETEYFEYNDTKNPILREDFESDKLDILPQADPNLASDMQRLGKAEALKSTIGAPGVDPRPIMIAYYRALKIEEDMIEQILPPPQPAPPDPEMLKMMKELEIEEAKLKLEEHKLRIKEIELTMAREKALVDNVKTQTESIKNLAVAEQTEVGNQLDLYQNKVERLTNERMAQSQSNTDIPSRAEKPSRPVIGNDGGT
jgi:chaperonin GroES